MTTPNTTTSAVLDAGQAKFKISMNGFGNWYGYERRQRDTFQYWEQVQEFYQTDIQTQEEAANEWLAYKTNH